jgi:membrane associated rhomboid family serine protease
MIIFPYRTDSSARTLPIVNFIFTALILAVSILFYFGKLDASVINSVMLSKWSILRAVGSIFIQPNLVSTIFISLFILLLGNTVNSVAGNVYYIVLLFLFCLIFSSVHLLTSDVRAIGGNGVISGLAGFAFAILPSNKLVIYRDEEEDEEGFSIFAIVCLWCAFDAYAIISYPAIPSLTAQLASFAAGIIIALLMAKYKIIKHNDSTFTEWMNDKVALLSYIDLIGSVMPKSKKRSADDVIKEKAEKLMELINTEEKNFSTAGEIIAPQPEVPVENSIKFRLLKGMKQKYYIVLYFVFEGDEISEVSITAENYKCEICPSKTLKPGDSGSIKIFSSNVDKITTAALLLKYNLRGITKTKVITYSAHSNELNN